MTINLTLIVLLAVVYSTGFYLLMQRSLMRIVLGVVLLGHGSNLFLQAAGGQPGEPPKACGSVLGVLSDPLPQAMALTAIVITFAVTTFLLALAYRSYALLGHDEVSDDVEDQRIRQHPGAEQESQAVVSDERGGPA